jgi:predicted RNA-binding protein with PIN domain
VVGRAASLFRHTPSHRSDRVSDRLIIVDGYNLILRTPELRPEGGRTLAESRQKLENLLAWMMGQEPHFLVVYDGAEGPGSSGRSGRVETRFSRPPQKADDLIRSLVEELLPKHERLTVVTSDAEVARHARAMGAEIALADLFLASVLGPGRGSGETPEKPASLSKKELEEWAELFRRRRPGDGEETEH